LGKVPSGGDFKLLVVLNLVACWQRKGTGGVGDCFDCAFVVMVIIELSRPGFAALLGVETLRTGFGILDFDRATREHF